MHRRTNRLPPAPSAIPPQGRVPPFIASAFVTPRAGLTGDAATRQMADDMRVGSQREGGITHDDLQLMGWTAEQVDAIAGKARVRAQRLTGAAA